MLTPGDYNRCFSDAPTCSGKLILTSPLLFGGGVVASVFAAFGTWTIVLIVLLVMSLIAAFVAYERRDDGYLGTDDLRALKPPDEKA